MWIVALDLRRPVTIIAMAALMMLFGLYAFSSIKKGNPGLIMAAIETFDFRRFDTSIRAGSKRQSYVT